MIYSRSAEYAIRAFTDLASLPAGQFAMSKDIAGRCKIPPFFLAKLLQDLARRGLLHSSKGPTGGFALVKPPEETSLLKIVSAVDGVSAFERCLEGHAQCTDQTACGIHDRWRALRSGIIGYLEGISVADLAQSLERKRRSVKPGNKGRSRRKVNE